MARRHVDLVGLAEIAESYHVQRNSAWRWSRRADFPTPAGVVSGRVPVWRRADVDRWAVKHLPLPVGRPRREP